MTSIDNHSTIIQGNQWSAAEVNEMLVKYDTISVGSFVGRTIQISNNAIPDSTSGGFDGVAAVASLQAKGFTVTTA